MQYLLRKNTYLFNIIASVRYKLRVFDELRCLLFFFNHNYFDLYFYHNVSLKDMFM